MHTRTHVQMLPSWPPPLTLTLKLRDLLAVLELPDFDLTGEGRHRHKAAVLTHGQVMVAQAIGLKDCQLLALRGVGAKGGGDQAQHLKLLRTSEVPPCLPPSPCLTLIAGSWF